MTTKAIDDGGPAYPQIGSEYVDHPVHGRIHRAHVGLDVNPGMSTRAVMATHFVAAMLASEHASDAGFYVPEAAADRACQFADAMIVKLKGGA